MSLVRFDELLIQPESTARHLAYLLTQPAPPQALLLIGSAGVGKRTLARALTAGWFCLQRTPQGHCGTCESCRKWSETNEHPDLQVLSPSPDQIKIESVRALRQWMSYAPVVAPCRLVIIEEAHRLNPAAANALLKTLEEPPSRYHFILTSPASDLLIPTILSRCQIVRLGTMTPEQVISALVARKGLEPSVAQQIAEFADGAIGRAFRWAEEIQGEHTQSEELTALRELIALFAEMAQAPLENALRLAERFRHICRQLESSTEDRSARSALALGLEYLLLWYRDSLALGGKHASLHFRSHADALHHLAQRFSSAQRLHALQAIIEARRAVLGNANAQVVTESLFIQLMSESPPHSRDGYLSSVRPTTSPWRSSS